MHPHQMVFMCFRIHVWVKAQQRTTFSVATVKRFLGIFAAIELHSLSSLSFLTWVIRGSPWCHTAFLWFANAFMSQRLRLLWWHYWCARSEVQVSNTNYVYIARTKDENNWRNHYKWGATEWFILTQFQAHGKNGNGAADLNNGFR